VVVVIVVVVAVVVVVVIVVIVIVVVVAVAVVVVVVVVVGGVVATNNKFKIGTVIEFQLPEITVPGRLMYIYIPKSVAITAEYLESVVQVC